MQPAEARRSPKPDAASPHPYLETVALLQRAHRRLHGAIDYALASEGFNGVTAVQALMLHSIGNEELSPGELQKFGHYLGVNVSYNIGKLVEAGFIEKRPSQDDRRSVRIRLADKGREVRDIVAAFYDRQATMMERAADVGVPDIVAVNATLRRLERFWVDQVAYRL